MAMWTVVVIRGNRRYYEQYVEPLARRVFRQRCGQNDRHESGCAELIDPAGTLREGHVSWPRRRR